MTIVVVGHGRSPEGRGWGSRIDSCDTVIRMWDWTWQPILDYGEKYDHGLFVLTPRGLTMFNKHNSRVPSRGWLAYMGKPTEGKLPPEVALVDPLPWVEIAQGMGGVGLSGRLTLTRGCVAAAWALSKPWLHAHSVTQRVVLVGFDNVQCGINQPIEQSFCPAYWQQFNQRFEDKLDKAYPVGTAKTATHDMSIELPLLRHLAEAHRVELCFAQDVWR